MSSSNKAWAPINEGKFIDSYNAGATDSDLANQFGGTRDKVQKYVRRLKSEGKLKPRSEVLLDYESFNFPNPELAVFGVTPEKFEPQMAWSKTDGASVLLKKKPVDWNGLIDRLAERAPSYPTIERPKYTNGMMLEPVFYDLHLGKHAWREEVGEDYDLKIACQVYRKAVSELFGRFNGETFKKVMLVWGQDLSHIDNKGGTTTKGTQLDFDSRYEKIVSTAVELGIETIEAATLFGDVEVVSIPGNHGRHTDFMICMVLAAYFRNNPHVTFDLSPMKRKYKQFGNVGLGFTHGDGFRPDKLPMIFAAEAPEIWGKTKFREFRHGHLHHNFVRDFPGCKVRQFPALSGVDAYHYDGGWIGQKKEAKILVWDEKEGLRAEYSHYA